MKLLRDFLLALVLVALSTSGGGALAVAALTGHACPRASAVPGAGAFVPGTAQPVRFQAVTRVGTHASMVAAPGVVQHACHVAGTLTLGAAPAPMPLVVPRGDGSLRPRPVRWLLAERIDALYRPPRA
ncbi:hypothetical protein [Pandoraea sp.]|uniref:hypothetical protein n=1 Tax=Pandoraea sp. TaxID=1883445 RepID=UPI0011FE721E|nr:hypothetical protein [Pandoraea sp.]TAL54533.1 MAG: hypothetical protein EPN80_10895 [Pandoraea sp.]TAM15767.1 MAG: hypothetical protein EPN65_17430 [Pandoraea sp.]